MTHYVYGWELEGRNASLYSTILVSGCVAIEDHGNPFTMLPEDRDGGSETHPSPEAALEWVRVVLNTLETDGYTLKVSGKVPVPEQLTEAGDIVEAWDSNVVEQL